MQLAGIAWTAVVERRHRPGNRVAFGPGGTPQLGEQMVERLRQPQFEVVGRERHQE